MAIRIKVRFDIQPEFKQGPDYKPYWRVEYFYSDQPIAETEIRRKLKELFDGKLTQIEGKWVRDIFIEEVVTIDGEIEDEWSISHLRYVNEGT